MKIGFVQHVVLATDCYFIFLGVSLPTRAQRRETPESKMMYIF
ncbi:MAG: hypothetical protein NZ455_07215 [Bacteroidia bacterium]|nr:hypothetical protein [Bacteroidia bacterium]MDW8346531.1 hypothetical protein [Bacteroidia bacterium]